MPTEPAAPLRTVAETDKSKARQWFQRAKTVADSRNYDYALEAYIGGLKVWPEAVEEGHKLLRAVSVMRKQTGGKPLGFLESRKYSTGGKDPLQNMLNAEFLWANDPGNLGHMEDFITNAAKAGCWLSGCWMGTLVGDVLVNEKKINPKQMVAFCAALDSIGEAAKSANQFAMAADAFNSMTKIAQIWYGNMKNSQEAMKIYSDASGKLAIVKGRFDSDEGFTKSIKDRDGQKDTYDRERMVTSEDRLEEMVKKARAEFEADRHSSPRLIALVDLLTKREDEKFENQAIELLTAEAESSGNPSLKFRAHDIRMRQLTRALRPLAAKYKADPKDEANTRQLKLLRREQLDFEIRSYEERCKAYPTDLRARFGLAEKLYSAKQYDQAIPYFQQAQADGKVRDACKMYIGRCFYEKKMFGEAANVLKQAIDHHEMGGGDDVGRDLYYWWARSLEAKGDVAGAGEVYGQIIQWDYNYRDARQRLETLRAGGAAG